jgi:hypothetical protein
VRRVKTEGSAAGGRTSVSAKKCNQWGLQPVSIPLRLPRKSLSSQQLRCTRTPSPSPTSRTVPPSGTVCGTHN